MTTRLASLRLSPPPAVLALILVVFLAPLPVSISSAQTSTTGNIEGTITDVNGATVPNATVTVAREGGRSASATTNEDGIFRITQLEPGRYTVTVDGAPGFVRFEKTNVEVSISKTTKLDVELRPANVTETVTAPSSSPAVNVTPPRIEFTETMSGGTRLVDLAVLQGNLKLYLPDDMRAGDTISGTLIAEPKGANEADKAKNAQTLQTFVIDIQGSRVSAGAGPFSFNVPSTGVKPGEFAAEGKLDMRLFSPPSNEVWKTSVPLTNTTPSGAVVTPDPKITPSTTSSGAVVTPDPKLSSNQSSLPGTTESTYVQGVTAVREIYDLPKLGQQGRLLQIVGPFDGNATNTKVRFLPPGTETKPNNYIADGIDVSKPVSPLAESPRQMVFASPTNFEGPVRLFVSDAGQTDSGPYNNVNVRLSAPKTDLMRGEKTTVTIEVSGLSGIIKDVPLQLDARGVINMDGGNFQNLRIRPDEVKLDGRYTTNRTITGVQAGGFNVTATVIVGPFDLCLQDDTDPNRLFRFNSFTGAYLFACGGGSCRGSASGGSGQTGNVTGQTGGTASGSTGAVSPTGVNLTGIGKPAMKGCIITLSHNAPDRRVFARLDTCTRTGDAQVETKAAKTTSEIKDKNTADNTCPSSIPK